MIIFAKKNAAYELAFPMVDATNPESFDTGETVTDTAFSKDGAAAWTSLAITDTVSEIGTTGMYEISLTAAEMNHDWIVIKFSSTNAQDTMISIKTFARDQDDLAFPTTSGNSIDVTATGEVGLDLDNTSGTLDAAQIGADAITAAKVAADVHAEAADAVWDEDIVAAHGTADTAGLILSELTKRAITFSTAVVDTSALGQMADDGTAVFDRTTDSLQALRDNLALDSVCSEARLSELDAATAGKAANQIDLIKTEADKIALVDAGAGTAGSVIEEVENNAAAIAALNDLSAAQVNTECDTALSDAGVNETRMSELDAGTAGKMANQVDIIQTDTTTDIPALLPAALVGGRIDANVGAISADATAADRLEAMMDGVIIGQVNDIAATTTAFAADGFTETDDDHFNGRLITFISGNLSGQQTDITDYDAAGGPQGSQEFTVTALTEAPANNDFFVIH